MKTATLFVVALCVLAVHATVSPHYFSQFQGYQVIRVNITTQKQIDVIVERQLDVWSGNSWAVLGENDIMVTPADISALRVNTYTVLVDDVAGAIRREFEENNGALLKEGAGWFDAYHNIDDINTFSSGLEATYPKLAAWVPVVGKSLQGRNIGLLNIHSDANTGKRKILLLGGQHAREWIGPATVLYIANKLLTGYGTNKTITDLVDKFDFVVIPSLNPDGYVWTWTDYRLWRKNRRLNSDRSYGVDLNRNWANHWCESGASRTPSSDTYCGTGPFSEPETQTIGNVTLIYGPFSGAIDFHSYGQLIMRPYGWSSTPPNNNAELARVGDGMRAAMIATTGTVYTNQAIWQLYLSAGSSADWWHDEGGIPLSFGFEARDTGRYGFELPPDQIIPSGEENFAAVAYLAAQVP